LEVTDSASNSARRLFHLMVSQAPMIYGQAVRDSVVFMVSAAGAMQGTTISSVRAAIVSALFDMPDGTRFDLVAFGSQFLQSNDYGRWFSGSTGSVVELNKLTRRLAITCMNGPATNPGSMNAMYHPLEAQTQSSPSSLKQIVLISASLPDWPSGYGAAELLADLQGWWAHFTDSQLVAVSLGTTSTDDLMQQMAALVGGVAVT
jgi:hypothetical protein